MKKFVFVLGAGASVDFKLPIGSELTGQIRKALWFDRAGPGYTGGDELLRSAFLESQAAYPDWMSAARLIASAMPLAPSIDNFVDVHKSNPTIAFCAKAAITRCILKAEQNSTIYISESNFYNVFDFDQNIRSWHTLFFRILTINCSLKELSARLSNIAIVSFNYDRCIEHFLFHAIKSYYNISDSECTQILNSLEIYHPYGKVGELPNLSDHDLVQYGADVPPERLLMLSKQIRTFTESINKESSDILRIREVVSGAMNLVFLGFAFHSLNVDLLFPSPYPEYRNSMRRIFATALGSSESDLRIIKSDLSMRFGCSDADVDLRNDLTCDRLFLEYSRTFSIA